ncbi:MULTISPECIES: hypothetical protein [Sandaracinus]|nr:MULTISPECIES: hypothetical protein [Sandaracinus]
MLKETAIAGEERAHDEGKLHRLSTGSVPRFARGADLFATKKEGER